MTKEMEKFQSDFKKMQGKLKPLKLATAIKIKKQLVAHLNKAWDAEDDLRAAIPEAANNGVTGTKLADFAKDKDFAAALARWKAACAAHKADIKALSDFIGDATKQLDQLKSRVETLTKDLKKSKQAPVDKKEIKKVLDPAEAAVEELTGIKAIYGTLKVPELFYAAKEQRTIEIILKKVQKKTAVGALPKILEEDAGKANVKKANDMCRSIVGLCGNAVKTAGKDIKGARNALKLADKKLDDLEKIYIGYQTAARKQKKDIGAAPNKKVLEKIIKDINSAFKSADAAFSKAEGDLDKAG